MLPVITYGVHVRSTPARSRGTWATFVTRAREAAGLPKVELARRLGVDRGTVARWESGLTRPEQADVVQRFTDLLALDLEEGLAAAGLRPTAPPTARPPLDSDLERMRRIFDDPLVSQATKDHIRSVLRAAAELAESQPRAPRRKAAG